ncbi:vomeronasal secretory protein 2-like [Alexandromys fortis]|uniref:vomeronasal secretory protein 2-like n=1 Tax=Alexandromys fortis TaxID=100897 RepID=UPI002153206A|nr:vomeronasal secretory protein 2-like [Microtus fortis]
MQSLLLTVTLCVLVAVLQAQDDLPYLSEEEKLSGVWFVKATVSEKNLTALRRPLVVFPLRVSCPQPGTLEVETTVTSEGECLKSRFRMQRTEEPGQYSAFLGQMLFIYELPAKDHYIVYLEYHLFGKKFQIVDLIGKHPKGNLEVLEEFKEFIQRKGLLQENVILPEQRGGNLLSQKAVTTLAGVLKRLQDHNC